LLNKERCPECGHDSIWFEQQTERSFLVGWFPKCERIKNGEAGKVPDEKEISGQPFGVNF
jgi:ssDNA-binding Zn-finger/Zn-ribbon topoisomerase 1